ncbi:MAG: hypothetical protein HY897_23385, partial [Deltaproteobacteria bacterium]|nr:hypothetical protein [Deltaproteobacteria bacterium]
MIRKGVACAAFAVAFVAFFGISRAEHFVPSPGEPGHDAELAAKALRYDRQFRAINAYQNGLSLDAQYRPEHRDLVTQFIQSGSGEDLKAAMGKHVYDVLFEYGEHGDLGMFGGVATAGDAFAYTVLRDSGAPAAEVQKARAALLRNLDAWHVYTDITGGQGLVARGIMLTSGPNPGDPAVPGGVPQTTPIPSQCNTLPADKHATWRPDLSGHHANYIWYDECSKDQYDGYAFALGVMWDAIAGDPDIPQSYRDRMKDDALKNAKALMKKNQVKTKVLPYDLDMVIMDPDGCATRWYGLNARVLDEGTP